MTTFAAAPFDTDAALNQAFPVLDLASLMGEWDEEAAASSSQLHDDAFVGNGDDSPMLLQDAHGADAFEDDSEGHAMAVEDDQDGANRGVALGGIGDGDFSDAPMPLGPNGIPIRTGVHLGADDSFDSLGYGGSAEASMRFAKAAVEEDEIPEPVVPELPADGGCLRATHLRSPLEWDAGLEVARTVCTRLGHVVSGVTSTATVLCTATEPATGAPVDFTVQVFTQCGREDRVLELQHAGRGDRLAFGAVYAAVANALRAEGACELVGEPAAEAEPRDAGVAFDALAPPTRVCEASRAVTVGAVSALSVGDLAPPSLGSRLSAPAGHTRDSSSPDEAGMRLMADRLAASVPAAGASAEGRSPCFGVNASEAAATLASVADRLTAMEPALAEETCGTLEAAGVPACLVSVVRASAERAEDDAHSVDDATVVPCIAALASLLACKSAGCASLVGSADAVQCAIASLSSTACAAADDRTAAAAAFSQQQKSTPSGEAAADLQGIPAHLAMFADPAAHRLGDVPASLSPPSPPRGDGPSAMGATWMAASGALLRLRAAARALNAAAAREGTVPGGDESWSVAVARVAAPGIAHLRAAAHTAGDAALSAHVSELVSSIRK